MKNNSDTTAPNIKLSPVTKLIYGTGRGVETLTFEAISIFYLYFLTDIVHLSPVTAALVLLFPRLWEGICNPIMGAISDRTRSRFGRRKPYMIGSALPIAVFFALMWIPIDLGTNTYTALFYGLVFFVFATAEAVFLVPYYSMGIEMTTDFDERTSVTTYREMAGMVFALIAATVPSLLIHSFADAKTGYMVTGTVLAVACGLMALFVGFNSKERSVENTEKPHYSFKDMLKPLVQNKQFLHVTVIFFMRELPGLFLYLLVEQAEPSAGIFDFKLCCMGGWHSVFQKGSRKKGKAFYIYTFFFNMDSILLVLFDSSKRCTAVCLLLNTVLLRPRLGILSCSSSIYACRHNRSGRADDRAKKRGTYVWNMGTFRPYRWCHSYDAYHVHSPEKRVCRKLRTAPVGA